jgi:hypothetical protein
MTLCCKVYVTGKFYALSPVYIKFGYLILLLRTNLRWRIRRNSWKACREKPNNLGGRMCTERAN